jgi:hypothetical protein
LRHVDRAEVAVVVEEAALLVTANEGNPDDLASVVNAFCKRLVGARCINGRDFTAATF